VREEKNNCAAPRADMSSGSPNFGLEYRTDSTGQHEMTGPRRMLRLESPREAPIAGCMLEDTQALSQAPPRTTGVAVAV